MGVVWLRSLIAFSAVVSVISGCAAQSEATQISVHYIGRSHNIPKDYLGVNGEALTTDLMGEAWNDPNLRAAVRRLRPGNIRIFGGTSANLWGWRRGRLIGPALPGIKGYRAGGPATPVSLQALMRVTRDAGATPLFDLNMVSSTLSSQIEMLRAAQRMGIPIKRVELGNELYSAPYTSVFADGTAYARVANRWITALHREFPGVLVALDAAIRGTNRDARYSQWNRQLFATARGEDAVTIHQYFTPVTWTAGPFSSNSRKQVAAPTIEWQKRTLPTLASIPSSLPVWFTEWNYQQSVDPSTVTWARALGNAEFAVRLAANRRIYLADYHSMLDGGTVGFGALTVAVARDHRIRYAFRADGVVLRTLLATLDGCTQVRAIGIDSSTVSGREPSLVGLSCAGQQAKPLVLVNPTGQSLQLDVSAVTTGISVTVRTFTADPAASGAGLTPRPAARASAESVHVGAWSLVSITPRK